MEYDNEKKGVLFKNNDKKSDKYPDYKGSATVNGVDYWLSAWVNTSKDGNKYMSISMQEKDGGFGDPPPSTGDTIPF